MSGLLALAFAAGMVAPVNPCGFALLPAWITLSLGDTTHHTALAGRLARALQSGVALTIGFAGTLVAAGLIVSAGARAVIDAAPWLGLATGVVLLLLAAVMLTGHSLGLRLPGIGRKPASRGHGVGQSVAYGVGFAGAGGRGAGGAEHRQQGGDHRREGRGGAGRHTPTASSGTDHGSSPRPFFRSGPCSPARERRVRECVCGRRHGALTGSGGSAAGPSDCNRSISSSATIASFRSSA